MKAVCHSPNTECAVHGKAEQVLGLDETWLSRTSAMKCFLGSQKRIGDGTISEWLLGRAIVFESDVLDSRRDALVH